LIFARITFFTKKILDGTEDFLTGIGSVKIVSAKGTKNGEIQKTKN